MTEKKERRYALEQELAPHIEPRWSEDFILELRLHGVAGDHIGAALAEADSHCAESGESAEEAFGPAAEYARSLELPVQDDGAELRRGLLPTVSKLVGMFMVIWSVSFYVQGEPAPIRLGAVLSLLLLVAVTVWTVLRPEGVLRTAVERTGLVILLNVLFVAVVVLLVWLLDQELFTVPSGTAMTAGAAVLLAGTLWELALLRNRPVGSEDVLASPLDDEQRLAGRRAAHGWADYLQILFLPAVTGVLVLMWFSVG